MVANSVAGTCVPDDVETFDRPITMHHTLVLLHGFGGSKRLFAEVALPDWRLTANLLLLLRPRGWQGSCFI